MKYVALLVCAYMAFTGRTAAAADSWSKQDMALQATYTALHIIDWGQTRYIAKNPKTFFERNAILGKHPTVDKVDMYFAGTLIAHALVTHFLPDKYRPWWQLATISMEGYCVNHNFKAGVRVAF